ATYDLFRSDDAGTTFVGSGFNGNATPTNPNIFQTDLDILHGQAWYNQAIVVDPLNPDRVLVGGDVSLVESFDPGGSSPILSDWLPVPYNLTVPYIHADLHSLAFGADGTLYAGSDGGISASTTNGFTSDKNVGLVTHLAYTVACAPESWPPEL